MKTVRYLLARLLGMIVVLAVVPTVPAILSLFVTHGGQSAVSQGTVSALVTAISSAWEQVLQILPVPPANILSGLLVSLLLVVLSVLLGAVVGMPIGIYAAVKKKQWFRHVGPMAGLVAQSLPTFLVASLLQLQFADIWHILPVGGWQSPASAILPVVSLAAGNVGYLAKFTQAGMTEVLQQDFIVSAKARGLPGWKVILRHALRPASLSTVTFFGPQAAMLINNTLLLQAIFQIPGLSGALGEQMSVTPQGGGIQGVATPFGTSGDTVLIFFLLAFVILFTNLLIDLLYRLLNPRAA